MRKVALSLFVAGSLTFGFSTADAEASAPSSQSVSINEGTYSTAHNVNLRSGAGTNNKILFLAKKGTKVTYVNEKKVGKEVWYQVKLNGKTGWALSTLLTKQSVSKSTNNVALANNVVESCNWIDRHSLPIWRNDDERVRLQRFCPICL